MDITLITTATGRVIEATTGYFAVRSQMNRGAWVEVEKTDGKMESIAAAIITGYGQATKVERSIGFA